MLPAGSHNGAILRKKTQKRLENETNASVKKEVARPRMAKSARILELKLRAARGLKSPRSTDPA